MAARKAGRVPATVDEWMAALEHPHKPALAALRELVAAADASIEEGVKWNSPSFRTTAWFATINARGKAPVAMILFAGVEKRDLPRPDIDDPQGLLDWRADDRAMLTFADLADVRRKKAAVQAIVRQWLPHVRA